MKKVCCPLCKQEISDYDCYEVGMCVDGLGPKSGVPPLIDRETIEVNRDICLACPYHFQDTYLSHKEVK